MRAGAHGVDGAVLLGAYHGLNPGMGWLFAVARGLQEGSRGAVLASLVPIPTGHEASVVVVVGPRSPLSTCSPRPPYGCWQPWSWCRCIFRPLVLMRESV